MSQREQVEIERLRKKIADAGDGVFTAADEAKLDGIETGATADQVWGEIGGTLSNQTDLQSALDAKQVDLDVVSQAEAEAGTATTERVWTAQRVAQAIAALESGGGGGGGVWTVIETIDASAASTIDFTSIPATYTQLRIRGWLETNEAVAEACLVSFNADTSTNYSYQQHFAANASNGVTESISTTGIWLAAGAYSPATIDVRIPNYTESSQRRVTHNFVSYWASINAGVAAHVAGLWNNTADVVDQITITPSTGTLNSHLVLEGA